MSENQITKRFMLKFSKQGKLRWISHLDTVRTLQKAIRRAEIPIAYSQGFNPHPKLSIAIPLALGYLSQGEYLDLELAEEMVGSEVQARLNEVLPEGLTILGNRELSTKVPSLMSLAQVSEYHIRVPAAEKAAWSLAIHNIWDMEALLLYKENKKKQQIEVDLRPGLLALELSSDMIEGKFLTLGIKLETSSSLFVRIQDIIDLLCFHGNLPWVSAIAVKAERMEIGSFTLGTYYSLADYPF